MKPLQKNYLILTVFLLLAGMTVFIIKLPKVNSQNEPLTYPKIITALNTKIPNDNFKSKKELINFLIETIKKDKVDKPLTDDIEGLLRASGATDELIEVIRQNIAPPPTPTPITPPPTPTPTIPPPPTSTATPVPNTDVNIKIVTNSLGMEFVNIPAGTFLMGSPPTEPNRNFDEFQHQVTLTKDFLMGRFEVTQAQWKTVMGNNPSFYNDEKCGDNCPVEMVSWDDVQEFITRLNGMGQGTYRLPTEAEWEYASRAGRDALPFGIGDGKNLSSDLANFNGDYPYGEGLKGFNLGKTTPVGSYPPNKYGLFDMNGNVREWCADWYAEYVKGAQKDPKGPPVGLYRVYRGGGFQSNGNGTRSAYRYNNSSTVRQPHLGFRLVKEN